MTHENKILLQALSGKKTEQTPFWLMRQAGRYLPEYRELRAKRNGFLDMVYHPESASEITLQPIRRYGMDGAIIFSDILVIPHALGQSVTFADGEGPRLDPLQSEDDFKKLNVENIDRILSPVYDTVRQTKSKLTSEGFGHTALIGFAGSPWTVACYMIEGRGSKDFEGARKWAAHHPQNFMNLMDILSAATLHYLSEQIKAGAEAVQLFDSWSGVLSDTLFDQFVIDPTRALVAALKKRHPQIPVIGFARGAGVKLKDYAEKTGVDAVGVDYTMPTHWVRDHVQSPAMCVQGNLDPIYLLNNAPDMARETLRVLSDLSGGPFIFNLGHGVMRETPPENIARLAQIIRNHAS
jgi:uroporphyrinogen decarboxylase